MQDCSQGVGDLGFPVKQRQSPSSLRSHSRAQQQYLQFGRLPMQGAMETTLSGLRVSHCRWLVALTT